MTLDSLHKPLMLTVAEKTMDAPGFATLFFDHALDFRPGQFVMLWIPGLDEKPYTVSYHSPKRFGVTIEAKGKFSNRAIAFEAGDRMGLRGPYGNGFSIPEKGHTLIVGGGCGMAPVATLIEQLPEATVLIQGARSREFLLYPDRFAIKRLVCTDDGSFGEKALVTDLLNREIKAGTPIDQIVACGPEIMMYKVFEICETHGIPCQVSLERYMRCGFGVCGACVCADRIVCKDGPVFDSQALRRMKDFNRQALLKSGEAVDLPRYFSWRNK